MKTPYFSEDLFQFLAELEDNNNRPWFNENKPRYREQIIDPAVAWLETLQKPLAKAAPLIVVNAKGYGGSIMRVYRDTRFGGNKNPYKTNVGISLRHESAADIHAPGLYIHLEVHECFFGAGLWRPSAQPLRQIREAIVNNPAVWKRAKNAKRFRDAFTIVGESLKTAPRGYPKDHPLIEDLRRKDFIAVSPLSFDQVTGSDLTETIIGLVKASRPWMNFLCDSVGLDY
ncbi:MAG: TIGR02453 family protein [Rhodopirellula sp. TMED11]|nr:MAG: TIGR02453 family protein [Rhodopirellula sp. TMED11]